MILEVKERRGSAEIWMAKIVQKLREYAKPKLEVPAPETKPPAQA